VGWIREGSGRRGGEMTQTLYVHMNKIKNKKDYSGAITG
jgi:hypothetical protein